MRTLVAMLGDPAGAESAAGMLIRRCGLELWIPADPAELVAGPLGAQTLCLFIDGPGESGLSALEALRVEAAGVLAVLSRPANPRELLSWLECLCVAQKYARLAA